MSREKAVLLQINMFMPRDAKSKRRGLRSPKPILITNSTHFYFMKDWAFPFPNMKLPIQVRILWWKECKIIFYHIGSEVEHFTREVNISSNTQIEDTVTS